MNDKKIKNQLEEDAFERPFDTGLVRRILVYLAPYTRQIIQGLLCLALCNVIFLAIPYITGRLIIDRFITGGDLRGLYIFCGVLVGMRLVHWAAQYRFEYLLAWAGQHVSFDIRTRLFTHLQALSMKFFDEKKVGWVIARLTGDINAIEEFFHFTVSSLVNILITFTGTIILMLVLNVQLALVVVFSIVPAMFGLTLYIRRKARKAYRRSRITNTDIVINLAENINGVRVTQSFGREDRNMEIFGEINRKNFDAQMYAARILAVYMPAVTFILGIGTLVVLWFGGRSVMAGTITVGSLVAFFAYIGYFIQPVRMLTELYNHMLNAMASAERIFGLLDTPVLVQDLPGAVPCTGIADGIRFENVTFGYNDDKMILNDVSFAVRPGQTVALVGPTGAGKSSVMNLISRFYDYQEGKIILDGKELKEYTLASLRGITGIVLQDSFLFDGTVRDNIRYGNLDASDDDIVRVAEMIGSHSFISEFPEQYDTRVREQGNRLSAGQKQLISFTRALLRDPKILILDEATSSIDAYMELAIQKALERLLKDRICFVAAHRLSTIQSADLILVIDDGRLQEMGTHRELMDKGGMYRDFCRTRYKFLGEE